MQPLYGNWLDGEWAYTGMLAQSRQGISAEAPLVRGKPQTADDVYVRDPGRGGDIYTKGAWTLHTLRNLIGDKARSEEHTSELQSLMRLAYAVFCLKRTNITTLKIIPQPVYTLFINEIIK